MKIVSYSPKYQKAFLQLNQAWISEMFTLEEEDIREMENIGPAIKQGGQIFFAVD